MSRHDIDMIRRAGASSGRRTRQRLCLGFCLAAVLAACAPPPAAPFRVGTQPWPGYEILFLARSLGYYRDTTIRLVELTSATEVIRALRSDMLEAAVLTLDEALPLIQDGIDLTVVLVMAVSSGGDVLLARPEITTIADLKGKRVGVENTAAGAILLNGALEAGQIPVSAIRVVPVTADEQEESYSSGAIDAVVTAEPVKSKLLKKGARTLFDSSQIPGRIINVLVVRASMIDSGTAPVATLVDGWFRALDKFRQKPLEAARQMAPRLGIDSGEVPAAFAGLQIPGIEDNHILLAGAEPFFPVVARRLVGLMVKQRLLHKPVPVATLVDGRFLPERRP